VAFSVAKRLAKGLKRTLAPSSGAAGRFPGKEAFSAAGASIFLFRRHMAYGFNRTLADLRSIDEGSMEGGGIGVSLSEIKPMYLLAWLDLARQEPQS
jgi:hypothetical protein